MSTIADSTFFTPTGDFFGTAELQYTLVDSYGAAVTGLVTIDVQPVNDYVTAVTDVISVPINGSTLLNVGANDEVPDGITSIVIDPPAFGTVTLVGSNLYRYDPATGTSGEFLLELHDHRRRRRQFRLVQCNYSWALATSKSPTTPPSPMLRLSTALSPLAMCGSQSSPHGVLVLSCPSGSFSTASPSGRRRQPNHSLRSWPTARSHYWTARHCSMDFTHSRPDSEPHQV